MKSKPLSLTESSGAQLRRALRHAEGAQEFKKVGVRFTQVIVTNSD